MRYNNTKRGDGMAFITGDAPKFNGNTFTVRTSPEAQAMQLPEPLPLTGAAAPYVDVKYEGEMNHADNTVTVTAMDQKGPEWRKFDMMRMKAHFNYLGLGMTESDRNYAFNVQFRITQQDAIAAAYASQLTELEFMAMLIQTSIPAMYGYNAGEKKYTGSGRFGYLVWYQAMLQNIAIVMGKYNTLMTYADYLIKMGYNAESHLTTRMINLMKKQNIWTLFDQLGNLLKSEFFDLTYYREITAMNTVPCRKENSVSEPLVIMSASVKMPDIAAYPSGAVVKVDFNDVPALDATTQVRKAFCDAIITAQGNLAYPTIFTYRPKVTPKQSWEDYLYALSYNIAQGYNRQACKEYGKVLDDLSTNYSDITMIDGATGSPTTTTFDTVVDLFDDVIERLDMFKIVQWAREQFFTGSTTESAASDLAVSYANDLIDRLVTLINVVTHFRADTSDLITFLRVLQNSTALNTWVLDTPYLHPSTPRAQAKPVYFKLIYDIINSYGTAGTMVKDTATRDWKVFTWWHQDEGIPKYDAYNGGFTIAASVRGIPEQAGSDYSSPEYMIPVLFHVDEISVMNRRGLRLPISQVTFFEEPKVIGGVTHQKEISEDPVLAAANLMALPASINLPEMDFHNVTFPAEGGSPATTKAKRQTEAQAIRMLAKFFGVGYIVDSSNTDYTFLDPLMEGLIGREFASCNTMALNYINGRAPFRTTDTNGGLGFKV